MNSEKCNEIQNWYCTTWHLVTLILNVYVKGKPGYGENSFSFFTHFLEKFTTRTHLCHRKFSWTFTSSSLNVLENIKKRKRRYFQLFDFFFLHYELRYQEHVRYEFRCALYAHFTIAFLYSRQSAKNWKLRSNFWYCIKIFIFMTIFFRYNCQTIYHLFS